MVVNIFVIGSLIGKYLIRYFCFKLDFFVFGYEFKCWDVSESVDVNLKKRVLKML